MTIINSKVCQSEFATNTITSFQQLETKCRSCQAISGHCPSCCWVDDSHIELVHLAGDDSPCLKTTMRICHTSGHLAALVALLVYQESILDIREAGNDDILLLARLQILGCRLETGDISSGCVGLHMVFLLNNISIEEH